jgi:hypothetical protein
MALDDYYSDPSQDCLARLFDAVNAMDISAAPVLSRAEKIVMRSSERKDVFAEKFVPTTSQGDIRLSVPLISGPFKAGHRSTNSGSSYSSFEEGLMMRQGAKKDDGRETHLEWDPTQGRGRERAGSQPTMLPQLQQHSPPGSSFSLGENPVWVGDESIQESISSSSGTSASMSGSTNRGRKSTDASSSSSSHNKDLGQGQGPAPPAVPHGTGLVKDTHFYHTSIAYKGHQLPIKLPLSTFSEEVGDVRRPLCSWQYSLT